MHRALQLRTWLALALLGLIAAACSVALDFDRTYTGRDEVYPAQDLYALSPPRDDESPDTGLCPAFCTRYLSCAGQFCHALTVALPEKAAQNQTDCEESCTRVGELTPSQLAYVERADSCQALAERTTEPLGDQCDFYVDYCRSMCDPPPGDESVVACEPGLTVETCQAFCETLKLDFFEAVEGQRAAEQPVCVQWDVAKSPREGNPDPLRLGDRCASLCDEDTGLPICNKSGLVRAACTGECESVVVADWACMAHAEEAQLALCEQAERCRAELTSPR
jgi:hypothetical protein